MATTTSRDGTRIAFTRAGQGPAVIVVDGALCYRASGPSASLADLLIAVAHTLPYDITIVEPNQQGRPLSAAR